MRSSFAAAAAVLVAIAPAAFGLTINTPTDIVECEPFQFTWSGGTPPYFLTLIPGQGDAPIKQFPETSNTAFTWLVDLQANTYFNVALKDSTGATAFSAQASIVAGSNSSCLYTGVIDSGSGSVAPTSSGASSASGASASPTGSHTASGSGSSPTAKGNGASVASSVSAFGIAGIFGLVGAVLF